MAFGLGVFGRIFARVRVEGFAHGPIDVTAAERGRKKDESAHRVPFRKLEQTPRQHDVGRKQQRRIEIVDRTRAIDDLLDPEAFDEPVEAGRILGRRQRHRNEPLEIDRVGPPFGGNLLSNRCEDALAGVGTANRRDDEAAAVSQQTRCN